MEKIRYTGQPFVDIGLTAILAFVQKQSLEQLEEQDLAHVAQYIGQNYVLPPLRSFLTIAFTSNAWFAQDAFNPDKPGLSVGEREKRQMKRADRADRHLSQWKREDIEQAEEGDFCLFTDTPAISSQLSDKLQPGRVARAQFPMVQSDEAINFSPYGNPGIPVSGVTLLALQFFPLACARCGVGLLAIHSDNAILMFALASKFLQQTIHDVTQAQVTHEEKLPPLLRSPKTLLIETLQEIERQRFYYEEDDEPASVTAYNFNNGKKQNLVIYHLPFEMIKFLRLVQTPIYRTNWQALVHRGWLQTGPKYQQRMNVLYEDLFTLPQEGVRFVRRYFLRPVLQKLKALPLEPGELFTADVYWRLLLLFLERVIRMDAARLARIEILGDGLALYVRRQGGRGKRFFRSFFTEQKSGMFRGLLIKVNIEHIRDGQTPLFDLGSYLEIFEEGEDILRPDWRFARDLVVMRMIDQLQDWLAQNPDAAVIEEEEEVKDNALLIE